MDDPLITVLIPTHDHGDLIEFPLRTVLNQTRQDFEILVIGDGMIDEGRRCVAAFMAKDPRVRLFDLPKAPRNGEAHRHGILAREARGQIVCYVSDDDMLMPRHLDAMVTALRDADFVYPVPNFIALHGAAHTMELYRRLPFGWRTTPPGRPTDLYMWQQMLSVPECRVAMSPYATTLHFPDPGRRGWTRQARRAELGEWEERVVSRPDGERLLSGMAIARLIWSRTHMGMRIGEVERSGA
jgi:GalNAc5-diNAcBac-PP-undecaprenol beta-1,3-glucosyltransferase